MADNEHQRQQPPALPPVDPAAPPPAVRPPSDITPEQIRQFQEFQHFQKLMREAADQGMPPGNPPPGLLQPWGQPPKQSLPKRLLKAAVGKIVTGLVVLAILVVAGYFAVDYFFGEDLNQAPAHETGGGKTTDNLILPTNPYEAVRMIYHQIANGDGVPDQVCSIRFKDNGKQFASDMGYDSCPDAVRGLHAQVTDRNDYAESMPSYKSTFSPQTHDEVRISSCADSRGGIQGGPPLGAFTVEKLAGSRAGQWQIVDHETEPPCTTPPTGPSN